MADRVPASDDPLDSMWSFALLLHQAGRHHADVDEVIVREELRRAEACAEWREEPLI